MNNSKSMRVARAGIIAALYAVFTIALAPISYGAIQFRISEALCILPLLFPETFVGLTIGCLIANIFGNGALDLILGTLATLLSSMLTLLVGKVFKNTTNKIILGGLSPVLFNAFIIPLTFLVVTDTIYTYLIACLTVGLGEAAAVYGLGTPLYLVIKKRYYFEK